MMNKTTTKKQKPILIQPRMAKKRQNQGVGILMEILLLYAGLLGYILCNTTALDMDIPVLIVVVTTALIFGLMILLSWYKRVFFSVLGGAALLSLVTYKISFPWFQSLGRALEFCYNYTIYLLGIQEGYTSNLDKMTMNLDDIIASPAAMSRYFYTAVILLSLIASILFAQTLFRRIPVLVTFGVTMVGLIHFFNYGIVPHYVAFSLFLSALIGCYGQSVVQYLRSGIRWKLRRQNKGQKIEKKKKKNRFTNAQRLEFAAGHGSFGMIIAGIMLVITMSTAVFIYARPILKMNDFRNAIDKAAVVLGNTFFRAQHEKDLNVAGYMEEGEILSLHSPTWRGLKVMGVTSSTETPIYLRYRTTVDLTENGWTVPEANYLADYESRVSYEFCENTQFYNYLSMVAPSRDPLTAGLDSIASEEEGYMADRITVYPMYKASTLLALPKGAVSKDPISDYGDLVREGDTVLYHNDHPSDRSYTYQVVTPLLTSNVFLTDFESMQQQYLIARNDSATRSNNPYLEQEYNYSLFVNSKYTSLPDSVKNYSAKLANEITASYDTKLEKVQALERYLRTNYTYSTTRQRLTYADGREATASDYIYHFLYEDEKKEGYCTLFASSMVAMARSLGYPARVATGYYAQPIMNELNNYGVELKDSNYHAWAEIYFDGMGWVPFEPTPGYGVEPNYYLLELTDTNQVNPLKPNVIIVYVDPPEGYIKYTNQLPDPTTEEKEETETDATPLGQLLNTLTPGSINGWAVAILICLLLFFLFIGIISAAAAKHRRSIAKLRRMAPDAAVKKAYIILMRLMQMRGFRFFEGELLEDFARRADNLMPFLIKLEYVIPHIQKVLYSDAPISEEERAIVVSYVEALDEDTFARVNSFKCFVYKWILEWKPRYKKLIWRF
ncbi:MAG: transglutaminase domain-containing protein [Clostridia bacterium]|nr:transglutaminase domain-containing protein [Clostridia bacterium]